MQECEENCTQVEKSTSQLMSFLQVRDDFGKYNKRMDKQTLYIFNCRSKTKTKMETQVQGQYVSIIHSTKGITNDHLLNRITKETDDAKQKRSC